MMPTVSFEPQTKLQSEGALCNPQAVANYFLEKSSPQGLTPMQLNKLVYIAHGWVLACLNRPLFDEPVEAWQHGPVVPSLYHEFKHFGAKPITEMSAMYVPDENRFITPRVKESYTQLVGLLDIVWQIYGRLSGGQLRSLTHTAGSPWAQSYSPGMRNVTISNDIIKPHYVDLINRLVVNAQSAR